MKGTTTSEQSRAIKARLRRAKESERKFGRWLLEHDGPNERFRPGGGLATSTARVGHITALQFDCISMSYAAENKNEKVPSTWWKYWKKIVEKAEGQGLEPVLRVEPTNDDRRGVPNLHIITEDRHAELLEYERQVRG